MAGADDGDSAGLRVGPFVNDSADEPVDASAEEAGVQPDADADDGSPKGRHAKRDGPVPEAGQADEWAPTGERPGRTASMPVTPPIGRARPGPQVLEADPWHPGSAKDPATEVYQGRRRANMPVIRPWIVIALILTGLGVIITLPLTMGSLLGGNGVAAPAMTSTVVGTSGVAEPGSVGLTPALSLSPSPNAPSPSPSRSPTTRPTATPRPPTTVPPTTVPPPPSFPPATYEAEAGQPAITLGGSAWAWDYPGASGGEIVRNVGAWGRPEGPGTVRFNNVSIPTNGTYTVTIHYVHPDNEANRTAVISISGIAPITASFAGGSTCCGVKVLTVALGAGAHTITIANPTNHAPSIDKLVIVRP